MLKIGEIVQRLRSTYAGGVPADDTTLSARHAYHALLTARSRLIEQKINKNQELSNWMIQILPCVELIKAAAHECPCAPIPDCFILRTKYKLPKPISSIGGHRIEYVTSIDGSERLDSTKFENVKYLKGNKYTGTKAKYYVHNGYGWVINRKMLNAITIGGIFEDPIEVIKFPSICGSDCEDCDCISFLDRDFPVEGSIADTMIAMAKEEIFQMKQISNDKVNDSEDNK
jgi:hypothetical protein